MFVNWYNLFSECNPRLIQGLLTEVIRFIRPTRFSIISITQRSQSSRLELMASTGMSALFSSIQSWRFVSSLCASVKVMHDDWSRTWTTLNVDIAENGVPGMKKRPEIQMSTWHSATSQLQNVCQLWSQLRLKVPPSLQRWRPAQAPPREQLLLGSSNE